MKIQKGENQTLLVFLDKHEASAVHIGAETRLESEKTRLILFQIYRQAAAQANITAARNEKSIVEILPFEDGSVLICFSHQKPKRPFKVHVRRRAAVCVFEIEGTATLESFLQSLEKIGELPSAVYKEGDRFRFILSGEKVGFIRLLEEYADKVGSSTEAAKTQEYWQKIY